MIPISIFLYASQLEYFTRSSPSHWVTLPGLELRETRVISGLPAGDAVTVVVRARNAHGLSPPSPISRPMETLPEEQEVEAGEDDPKETRARLAGEEVLVREAAAVGPRRIRMEWEVASASASASVSLAEGFHIQVRDDGAARWSRRTEEGEARQTFDVITIAGGGTR